jgi:sigma-B regulation protein RsbU (phosphoserine phosphatase)
MLCHMNRRLQQPRLDNRFVAMAFAVYDRADRSLTLANAGFPRPLLLRDGRVEEVPVQGLPLGILPEPRYEQRTLELREGDVVVFCSDGLKECMDRDGEEFGSARLEALLIRESASTAQEIADRLLEATATHAGAEGDPQDDRTVVVLKLRQLR